MRSLLSGFPSMVRAFSEIAYSQIASASELKSNPSFTNNRPQTKRHLQKGLFGLAILVCLFSVVSSNAQTQTNTEVVQAISLLEKGELNQVKQQLPTLTTKYQNDPGVLYLQGRLATNGNEARQYYQTIVSNFPTCDWADDALYRLYQYNYAMGLYRTASAQLQQLAKDYPNSPYVKSVPQSGIPKTDKPLVTANQKHDETKIESKQETGKGLNQGKTVEQPKLILPPIQEKFTLQVGAFSTSENAEKMKESFEAKGYKVEVANKVQNGKSLFKVWVGAYKSRDEAVKASKEVKQKYSLNSIVIERF